MKMTSLVKLAAMSALCCTVVAQAQFAKPDDAIEYRQSAMTIMSAHFGRLGAMVQGKVPFDAKVAQDNAAVFAVVSKLPWAAFGEGTDKGADTKAKAEIWSDQAKFKAAQEKFLAETVKLDAAVKTGKLEDLSVAFKGVGGTCKGCHESFKAK